MLSYFGMTQMPLTPEDRYLASVPPDRRRELGQFFTPYDIAEFMVKWISVTRPQSVLDPAVGTGVFLRALAREFAETVQPSSILGIDIDAQVLKFAQESLGEQPGLELHAGDFLAWDSQDQFDAIVCNPPYYKHHFIAGKNELIERLNSQCGTNLTRTTSVYCLFLVKAVNMLSEGGRCAFIVPTEFMNSDYGVQVKSYLLEERLLDAIVGLSYESRAFSEALTTTCILLISKDSAKRRGTPVKLYLARDKTELRALFSGILNGAANPVASLFEREIDPGRKWHNYFSGRLASKLEGRLIPLATIAHCSRGIATGSNEFFTVSEQERIENGISTNEVKPCLTKSSHANKLVFTTQDFERLHKQNKKCFLISPDRDPSGSMKGYLERGKEFGFDKRFLTRNRKCWYAPEKRPPAHIWVTVFFRGTPRFVLNQAQILNLTTFHGIYLEPMFRPHQDSLFAYLNSSYCEPFISQHRREYGDGLLKLEPKDVERILVPDLTRLDPECLAYLAKAVSSLIDGQCSEDNFRETVDSVFAASALFAESSIPAG